MPARNDSEYLILAIFLIGIITSIYYLISVMTVGADAMAIFEKTILIGVIIAILIALAIVLLKQMELKEQIEAIRQPQPMAAAKRTAKDVKADMMRIYRDMGAMKIVLTDKLIDKATYDRERKDLDKRIVLLKKEYEKLVKPIKPKK